jgi:hypothetical protein
MLPAVMQVRQGRMEGGGGGVQMVWGCTADGGGAKLHQNGRAKSTHHFCGQSCRCGW